MTSKTFLAPALAIAATAALAAPAPGQIGPGPDLADGTQDLTAQIDGALADGGPRALVYTTHPQQSGALVDTYVGQATDEVSVDVAADFLTLLPSETWDFVLLNGDGTATGFADVAAAAFTVVGNSAPVLATEWDTQLSRMSETTADWLALGYEITAESIAMDISDPTVAGTLFQVQETPGNVRCLFVTGPDDGWSVELSVPAAPPAFFSSKGLKDLACALWATFLCSLQDQAGANDGAFAAAVDQDSCRSCKQCLRLVWNFKVDNHCHKCDGCVIPLCETIWCTVFGFCSGC